MASGETLLKLTDFPFSYSIVGIAMGILGFDINEKYLSFLAIAGFIGTFLTITDPIGKIVRWSIRDNLRKRKYPASIDENTEAKVVYTQMAISSKSVGIETDKIVSLIYFVSVLALFPVPLHTSDSFAERFLFYTEDGEILCSVGCIKIGGTLISVAALIILFSLSMDLVL